VSTTDLTPAVLRELAIAAKVCVRPVLLRCTDTSTGDTQTVPIACGATIETTCPPCSERARRLRMQQCREGWHREEEPDLEPDATSDPLETDGELEDVGAGGERRTRSTKRRNDVADLPRIPMDARTVGKTFRSPDGRVFRPSMFLTLTLPSYGTVRPDGTPVDPSTYDYRRAALDALHFSKLEDRFWQNLRRCAGYKVQYFAAVEPQRRRAPHLHAAVRGVIPRQIVRQVVAGTYHQIWWPPCTTVVFGEDAAQPVWDEATATYLDPDTGRPLPTWQQALDDLDADVAARPMHVMRFGRQLHYQGLIAADADQVNRAVGYLTKYLTKSIGADPDTEQDLTPNQVQHLRRLHAEIRFLPCSPRCSNWLRFGVQPDGATAGMQAGACPAKAHDQRHLGLGGRRVHVSRQWTGKTLAEHAADRATVVAATLAEAGMDTPDRQRCSGTVLDADGRVRFLWERIAHHDQDALTYRQAIAAAIAERTRWRAQYDEAVALVGAGASQRAEGIR
jgi:hypothetical protein